MNVKVLKFLRAIFYFAFFILLFLFSYISTPSLLQIFSTFLLVLTLKAILDAKGGLGARLLKYIVYVVYLIYSLYTLGIFYNIEEVLNALTLNLQEISQDAIFKIYSGLIAPIAILILGKQISKAEVKGRQIFNFFTIWVIFLVLAFAWDVLYPNDVLIEFLFAFWTMSLLTIAYYSLKSPNKSNTNNNSSPGGK